MKLTILGCSGSGPGPDSPASGYLVESGGTRLLVDLGSGAFGPLQRFIDPFALDAVALSHLHPDHCADLAALTVARRYRPDQPHEAERKRLPVHGPAETPTRLAGLYAASRAERDETDLSDVYEFAELDRGPVRIGAFELRAVPMRHVCPAWGFRIAAEGRVLAYTGDTGPCGELGELADRADVLLSEASWTDFPDAPTDVHLSGRQAGETASAAGSRRLLLTHLQPWTDREAILAEANEVFDGPTELVQQGRTYEV